ncbi:hypothetical protein Q8A67_024634 [Cirrhinus molitorella]|uniref:Uncharacterized protein n=1 Tax=Cirrhinus molitorella TaxID=172907 RepID=A0AA88TAN1_9TELE|nr:hypothetical protein Q8A67_024634 [Cirrhinus molitorella]
MWIQPSSIFVAFRPSLCLTCIDSAQEAPKHNLKVNIHSICLCLHNGGSYMPTGANDEMQTSLLQYIVKLNCSGLPVI